MMKEKGISDNYELPNDYMEFLEGNNEGVLIKHPTADFRTQIFSKSELFEWIEMHHIGKAEKYECLKLFIKFQRDYGYADQEEPTLNEDEMKRVESGFVIGGGYDGYLYFDASLENSIWMFYPGDYGRIEKITDTFSELIEKF